MVRNLGRQDLIRMTLPVKFSGFRLRRLSTSLPGRLQRSCADHQRLCQAYEERDELLAGALNRSILMGALTAIETAWASRRHEM